MAKDLRPYDPNRRSDSNRSADPRSGDKHFHYYDHRTFVQGGPERDDGGDEDELPPRAPVLLTWQKRAFILIFAVIVLGVLIRILVPTTPNGSQDQVADAPVSCVGHWSYAPSLEQAIDVYVTEAAQSYNMLISKLDVNAGDRDFQWTANVGMLQNTAEKDGVLVQAILHENSGATTLECRSTGATLKYGGQSYILRKSAVGLKATVAANGWQWPIAPDPNKVQASACEGYWLLELPTGQAAITVDRTENFYAVSLLTPDTADSNERLVATIGDASHLEINWANRRFSMLCNGKAAGASFGDDKPAAVMSRLSPVGYHRLIARWRAAKAASEATQGDPNYNYSE